MSPGKISQMEFVKSYYFERPGQDISHAHAKEEIETSWFELTGKRMEDSDRAIRKLHQLGFLKKIGKGLYRYDPESVNRRHLEDFPESLKKRILKRDAYKCRVCGLGKAEGIELHIDHIKAKDHGGQATFENGQTLCSKHNFMKKNLHVSTLGKKLFISLYEDALKSNTDIGKQMATFANDVLLTYEKHDIDSEIEWEPKTLEE